MTWPPTHPSDIEDIATFARASDALRDLQDALASSRMDRAAFADLADTLESARDALVPLATDEEHQALGRTRQLPVRGHTMVPEFRVTHRDEKSIEGTVVFGRWFMGGGMAAHGGAIALLFDEIIGSLVSRAIGKRIRTAYLKVDYRAITPIEVELRPVARVDRIEGRKIFVRGELWNGDILCAEADALFLVLLPHQQ